MKSILALCALCFALTNALSSRDMFEKFGSDHGRKYSSPAEKAHRFDIFQQNLLKIKKLNANSKHATFAVNQFADMTTEEFKDTMLMPSIDAKALAQSCLAKGMYYPQSESS